MPYFECNNIRIAGIACAVPETIVKVDSFENQVGKEAIEKFKKATGIERFHKTLDNQTASDLGYAAAKKLLEQLNISPETIQALLFVSHSPDYRRPATAAVLQMRLGLPKDCACYDINLGCSAYPYGVVTLSSMMECSNISRALLICAESPTKIANPLDRTTAMLFGDAGSASLLLKEKSHCCGIKGAMRTDGYNYRAIIVPAGGFRNLYAPKDITCWHDGNQRHLHNLYMNGGDVFNFTITEVPRLIQEFLQHYEVTVEEFDSFIMHQANLFIMKQISRKARFPLEKMPVSLDRYGNTSAAAIPLTLCDAYAKQNTNTQSNIKVLMCGYGVGLSWGVISATLTTNELVPVFTSNETFTEGLIESPTDLE